MGKRRVELGDASCEIEFAFKRPPEAACSMESAAVPVTVQHFAAPLPPFAAGGFGFPNGMFAPPVPNGGGSYVHAFGSGNPYDMGAQPPAPYGMKGVGWMPFGKGAFAPS